MTNNETTNSLQNFVQTAEQRLKTLSEGYYKAKTEMMKSMEPVFLNAFSEVFDKFPELQSIGWVQYTPHFNDGDPCQFGVHADVDWGVRINGSQSDNWEIVVIGKKEYRHKNWQGIETVQYYDDTELAPHELWKEDAAKAVSRIVDMIPNELLEEMFGEGEITINRDGSSEVSEYSHD